MVALREKITAWLFVLNSCLRASNCSRRFSSPAGRLPAAGLLFGYSSFAAGSLAGGGDLSPDPLPTASPRASAFSPPSTASAKTVLGAPRSCKCECPGGTALGKEERAPPGHPETWHGARQPGRDVPVARCTLHVARGGQPTKDSPVARCMVGAAQQGRPRCTLHLAPCMLGAAQRGRSHCPLHVAQRVPRSRGGGTRGATQGGSTLGGTVPCVRPGDSPRQK